MTRRTLSHHEIAEAQLVFLGRLDTDPVRIIEGVRWTNTLSRIHAWLRGVEPPSDNAVTLGNCIYFPRPLETGEGTQAFSLTDMGWLMHELTHVWQYQHDGIIYLFQALHVQLRFGKKAYAYGGSDGLRQALKTGKSLKDFNREQQADIVRHYYLRLRQDRETDAWMPFVQQL